MKYEKIVDGFKAKLFQDQISSDYGSIFESMH